MVGLYYCLELRGLVIVCLVMVLFNFGMAQRNIIAVIIYTIIATGASAPLPRRPTAATTPALLFRLTLRLAAASTTA